MNDDLQNALEQLKLGVNKRYGTTILLPGESQALLDERKALRDTCEAISQIGRFNQYSLEQAIELACAALAKTQSGDVIETSHLRHKTRNEET